MWKRSPLSVGASGRRGEECRVREMLGLFDELDQRRRVARKPGDLHLPVLDPQFIEISVVGQRLRKRLDHDDARRSGALSRLERRQRFVGDRAAPAYQCGVALGNPALEAHSLRVEIVADDDRSAGAEARSGADQDEQRDQRAAQSAQRAIRRRRAAQKQ